MWGHLSSQSKYILGGKKEENKHNFSLFPYRFDFYAQIKERFYFYARITHKKRVIVLRLGISTGQTGFMLSYVLPAASSNKEN